MIDWDEQIRSAVADVVFATVRRSTMQGNGGLIMAAE